MLLKNLEQVVAVCRPRAFASLYLCDFRELIFHNLLLEVFVREFGQALGGALEQPRFYAPLHNAPQLFDAVKLKHALAVRNFLPEASRAAVAAP